MNNFLRHMPSVAAYSQRLAALQNVWDSLSLLSQMSGDGTNIGQTREAFESLSRELVNQLSSETATKAIFDMRAKAQAAIDIMVRNLFERTADIGFLSCDETIVSFMQSCVNGASPDAHAVQSLRKYLKEYTTKYSVYENIVLTATDGTVLLQLDDHHPLQQTNDAIVSKALSTTTKYVESHGHSDLLNNQPGLIYAYRVESQQKSVGVLCLCFKLQDETNAIFNQLISKEDWAIITYLDAKGQVIASSDVWQIPLGAKLDLATDNEGRVIRFAGREYLAITRGTQGYEGYRGPGWMAHVMVPLHGAFEQSTAQALGNIDGQLLADAQRNASIFSEQLRAIPQQADHIQRELTKSVWNGNVNLVSHDGKENSFSKSLLREISATGKRTKEVFEQSIGDLHETVISAILHDGRFRASLCVEVLDRNLYERSNDVRWWALNTTLQESLEQDADPSAATQTLHQINQLYTVYDNIMLFDRNCRIIATSNPKRRALVGTTLSQSWAREALTLRDSQSYCVSQFEPLAAYDDQHCYVFAAAVRASDHRVVGALAVVFDCATQLSAMLHDVLPLTADGQITAGYTGLLIDSAGKVIASTHDHKPGVTMNLSPQLLSPPPEGSVDVMIFNGQYHAVGARHCHGYREYPGIGVTAVVMRSLGDQHTGKSRNASALTFTHRTKQGTDTLDLAVVSCGEHWLAIPSKSVVEAIDDTAVTRVPGRAQWFSGVTRYQGSMLPVVDLSQWISTGTTAVRTSRAVVVVQEGDDLIGLAIDQLGDVLTVARDEIVTMDTLGTNARTKLTPQVVRPRSANDSALLLLDIQALAALLNPERYARSA